MHTTCEIYEINKIYEISDEIIIYSTIIYVDHMPFHTHLYYTVYVGFVRMPIGPIAITSIKKVGNARVGESNLKPISPKTLAPQYQPMERERKERENSRRRKGSEHQLGLVKLLKPADQRAEMKSWYRKGVGEYSGSMSIETVWTRAENGRVPYYYYYYYY